MAVGVARVLASCGRHTGERPPHEVHSINGRLGTMGTRACRTGIPGDRWSQGLESESWEGPSISPSGAPQSASSRQCPFCQVLEVQP